MIWLVVNIARKSSLFDLRAFENDARSVDARCKLSRLAKMKEMGQNQFHFNAHNAKNLPWNFTKWACGIEQNGC
jgi:hypothetical protein